MSNDDLNPEDALCLEIGRVARSHVWLDNALGDVRFALLQSLGEPTTASDWLKRTTDRVRDMRDALDRVPLDDRVRRGALSAMDAALTANDKRNRLIHDLWLRDPIHDPTEADRQPRWFGSSGKGRRTNAGVPEPPRNLDFMRDALEQIRYANARVVSLLWLLWEVLPYYGRGEWLEHDSQTEIDWHLPIVEGNLRLTADGGVQHRTPPQR